MADIIISTPSASMELMALPPAGWNFIPAAAMTLTPLNPTGVVILPDERIAASRTIFRCILTGDGDGLDDLVIPIAKFSATIREGDPSYLSCAAPCGSLYAAEILKRQNGHIVIRSGVALRDGTEYLEEIVRVNYETIGSERTGTTDMLSLTGHKSRTLRQSKEWTLAGASYLSTDAAGKRRIRGNIDFRLRCGDICVYGAGIGESLVVGAISYTVAANPVVAIMEVAEA
jgi:hypothetical protein